MIKVLVADDDGAIRSLVSEVLKDGGYSVLTAAHGDEALRICEESRPDIVFTDPRMPAIIALAKNLDLHIIAEGVEKRQQLSFLQKHECDAIQGFLVCPPLNVEGIEEFLRLKGQKALLNSYKKI